MYIRRTQTRNTATGERYYTYRLVRSQRVGGKVRQVTLLNLGRHFAIAQADWPTLCVRLEEILSGQGVMLGGCGSLAIEREAQRLAAQLLARAEALATESAPGGQTSAEVHSVEIDSLTLARPRTVGVEALGLWAMAQLDFIALLERLGLTGPQRAAVAGVIVGRMAAPGSELATQRWLCERSALGELLDVDFEAMSLMQLYRAGDVLMRHREALEKAVFSRVSELFGLDWTVTLYDLTNTYFEGEAPSNPKARRGHSKEKRSDCLLLTLGLVLDASGFVRRSQVLCSARSNRRLGLRPIFHHKEARADGHLFITVLAYQFVQLIRRRLHAQGIRESWKRLRETLNGQVRVTVTFRRPDGRTLHVRKTTQAEPEQHRIYQALGIDPSPGGVRKMLV
jgi:hypothetical protein